MKKITPGELKAGCVYNKIYRGDNPYYTKHYGVETFRVLEDTPQLKTVTIFSSLNPWPLSEELCGNDTRFINPDFAFKEYDLYEPKDETEWFKRSIKVSSLSEAVERGLIASGNITGRHWYRSSLTSMSDQDSRHAGYYTTMSVEGSAENPHLKTVVIHWTRFADLLADFKKFGITIPH